MSKIVVVLSKIADFLVKKSRSGEKEQELEAKKVDVYKNLTFVLTIVVLFMCVISSLKPDLAITEYWFNLLDRLIEVTQ
mgnify:CR=1 FL=1|jgi:hypothetical protein